MPVHDRPLQIILHPPPPEDFAEDLARPVERGVHVINVDIRPRTSISRYPTGEELFVFRNDVDADGICEGDGVSGLIFS